MRIQFRLMTRKEKGEGSRGGEDSLLVPATSDGGDEVLGEPLGHERRLESRRSRHRGARRRSSRWLVRSIGWRRRWMVRWWLDWIGQDPEEGGALSFALVGLVERSRRGR